VFAAQVVGTGQAGNAGTDDCDIQCSESSWRNRRSS